MGMIASGCNKNKPFAILSREPIREETQFERIFPENTRIYYAVVSPKGFKNNVLRVQIIKKDEKSEFWGYAYHRSEDYQIKNPYYFTNYIVLSQSGQYFLRVFEKHNLNTPIVHEGFWVKSY